MSLELLKLAIKCEEDNTLRCLVFTGEGDQSFCAGGDLYSFKNSVRIKIVKHIFL